METEKESHTGHTVEMTDDTNDQENENEMSIFQVFTDFFSVAVESKVSADEGSLFFLYFVLWAVSFDSFSGLRCVCVIYTAPA